jgi:hypothetical protein
MANQGALGREGECQADASDAILHVRLRLDLKWHAHGESHEIPKLLQIGAAAGRCVCALALFGARHKKPQCSKFDPGSPSTR